MANRIHDTRRAALKLSRAQFDKFSNLEVSAIAQAFYLGGKIATKKDRERVWDHLRKPEVRCLMTK